MAVRTWSGTGPTRACTPSALRSGTSSGNMFSDRFIERIPQETGRVSAGTGGPRRCRTTSVRPTNRNIAARTYGIAWSISKNWQALTRAITMAEETRVHRMPIFFSACTGPQAPASAGISTCSKDWPVPSPKKRGKTPPQRQKKERGARFREPRAWWQQAGRQ